jgi:hypothetical protein
MLGSTTGHHIYNEVVNEGYTRRSCLLPEGKEKERTKSFGVVRLS